MDNSDSGRKVPATKKLPSRSAKKRVVYFDKSDSELESDEDGDEAPKKRSFKKKANATNNNEFELGPDAAPALTHFLGMSESARLYTLRALAPDQSPVLKHLLGTSENARSYTSRALTPVTNFLSQRNKKSWPSQRQSSGKENWGSDVNMVSLQIPPSKMATKPRAVSLSPEDYNKTDFNEDSSSETEFDEDSSSETEFDQDSSSEMEFGEDSVDFDGNDTNIYFIAKPFDDAAKKAELILNKTLVRMKKQDKGPTTELETAYLVTLKSNLVDLFRLGYGLLSDKCKRDDLGRHVYEPQPMEGSASKSAGCYKVQVPGGNNKRVKTG
jgi:hypothetical protein